MDSTAQRLIEKRIEKIVRDLFPKARLVEKYGGTLIETIPDNSNSQIGGYFFYKNHMSFEFSNGACLRDTYSVLSGSGKQRRHIKVVDPQDFREEALRDLLKQAYQKVIETD